VSVQAAAKYAGGGAHVSEMMKLPFLAKSRCHHLIFLALLALLALSVSESRREEMISLRLGCRRVRCSVWMCQWRGIRGIADGMREIGRGMHASLPACQLTTEFTATPCLSAWPKSVSLVSASSAELIFHKVLARPRSKTLN
jgi:hypothetical protein